MVFLQKNLRTSYLHPPGQLQREEVLEIPEDALREALLNAVTHRDYANPGINVTVEIYEHRVEISNYGGLPAGLEKKQFGKKSVVRNKLIADLMHKAKYIEKWGTGIPKIKESVKDAGLPPVQFKFDNYFTVLFRRRIYRGKGSHHIKTQRTIKLLASIKNNTFSKRGFAKLENIVSRTVERELNQLIKQGLIFYKGAPKNGRYCLTEKLAVIRIFVEKADMGVGVDGRVGAKDIVAITGRTIKDIVAITGLNIEDVTKTIKQLEAEKLVHVAWGDGPEETLVYAYRALFARFDSLWMPWNTVEDALVIATGYSIDKKFPSDPKLVSEAFNMPPRRLNPAIHYLMENRIVEASVTLDRTPFGYSHIDPNMENIAKFIDEG